MHIYIPIIPILWGVLIWAGIGVALFIPLDIYLSKRLARINMGYRPRGVNQIIKRAFHYPVDTISAIMVWPYLVYVVFFKQRNR